MHLPLSRKAHGIMDYLFALIVGASPWIFGFAHEPAAPQIALACGIVTAMYSLLTNYEMGLVPLIPFAGHRFFDFIVAIALAGSSWHFKMRGTAAVVFTVLGVIGIIAAATSPRPRASGSVAH
jgi:hypothetical protein